MDRKRLERRVQEEKREPLMIHGWEEILVVLMVSPIIWVLSRWFFTRCADWSDEW